MLSKSIKRVWGISEVGFSVMSTMETSFPVFFLTDVALLPLGITAVITGFAALADAVSAILAGIVVSKVTFITGKDTQGVIMAFNAHAIKISLALRNLIIPAALAYIVYDASLKVFALEMMDGIRLIYILMPCIFIALSFIPLVFFRLSDEKVAEMEDEITARKGAAKAI